MSAEGATSTGADRHILLVGAHRRDRAARCRELVLPPPLLPAVSAHRRLRGPYTAAGTLMRAVVPGVFAERPDLVSTHEVEILSVAPELRDLVPASLETLTSLASPAERTRYYSRLRTRRIAHGLTDFLLAVLSADGTGSRSVFVDALDQADPTDREFMAVLLRRMPARLLTLVVGGTEALLVPPVPDERLEPGTKGNEELSPSVLERHCRRVDAPRSSQGAAGGAEMSGDGPDEAAAAAAERYVNGDGTDDELLAAYLRAPLSARRELHDLRAAELRADGQRSWAFGAIPYHLMHGADPLGAGTAALLDAMDDCMRHGFYDAAIDFCDRGRALVDRERDFGLWWKLTRKLPTCLSAMGRAEEAEAICDEARARTRDAAIHIECAYATAMLYTRHREAGRRDHVRAMAWINEAIAIASLLPDPKDRAFNTVFHSNGLALIEAHRKRPLAALDLVTSGIATLDRELGADEHHLHRSVLRHNRAQVLTALGRLDEALTDLRAVVEVDPYYPEYHFDLANLLRRAGRWQEALDEYRTALRLGPPFPEAYYNRGDLRNELGDTEGALEDFTLVLELDPDFTDAYVNRSGIHLAAGDLAAAESDALAGLVESPDNPHLLAVLGQVHGEREEHEAARAAFDRALAADPDLVAALCGRATVAHATGHAAIALADLERAVALAPDDPAVRFNHAYLLQDAGRWQEALAELDIAAGLAPDDPDVLLARDDCRARVTVS
ncbi:tetratricopeptide repeat protein [Streptomyces sp. DT171]|uniref:tetratricopeptide repeat protein n=1 Tax=Streptomyces sp. DT171 TaxID=3416524 RepID=UPI003CE6A5D3